MNLDAVIAQLVGIPAAIVASAIFAGLGYLTAVFRSRRPALVWGEAPNPVIALKNGNPGISMQFASIFSENCGSSIVPEIRIRVMGEFSAVSTSPDKDFEIKEIKNHLNRNEVIIYNVLPREVLRINVMNVKMGLLHEGWDKMSMLEIVSLSAGKHSVSRTTFEPLSNHTKARDKIISFFMGVATLLGALAICFILLYYLK